MASPPFSLNTSTPGDNDFASVFPLDERTLRDIIQSWIEVEHDTNGQHRFSTYVDGGFQGPPGAGKFRVYSTQDDLWVINGGGTIVHRVDHFPAGTAMLFMNANPPTGWTTDISFVDRALHIGTTGQGGTSGGSWSISGLSVQGHQLTTAEMPSHVHNAGAAGTSVAQSGTGFSFTYVTGQGNTGSQGGDQPHSHGISSDGSWRPAFVRAVNGIKS